MIAAGAGNDAEMDGGPVKDEAWTHAASRLYHLKK
jgi:hypothetical protein